MDVWIFGYGSLIWRPDIDYLERHPARVHGYERRFWQGSHDHRGLPHRPGRVVTLVENPRGFCDGVAYLVHRETAGATFDMLDHREKNGYQRVPVHLEFRDGNRTEPGVVYIAPRDNFAYLGPAPMAEMVAQIRTSIGPSGANVDYLMDLTRALHELEAEDHHVFELARAVMGER